MSLPIRKSNLIYAHRHWVTTSVGCLAVLLEILCLRDCLEVTNCSYSDVDIFLNAEEQLIAIVICFLSLIMLLRDNSNKYTTIMP